LFTNPNKKEILISTYSGKIMTLAEKSGLKATATPLNTSSKAVGIDKKPIKTELEQ